MADPQGVTTVPGPLISDPVVSEHATERDFVLECVERADVKKRKKVPIWDEVLENYFLTSPKGRSADFPFGFSRGTFPGADQPDLRSGAELRDPETHQVIENLSIQTIRLVLGSPRYMNARPIGNVGPGKADMLTSIMMAVNSVHGRYRSFLEVMKESFLLGTGVAEIPFEIRSRQQLVRHRTTRRGFVTGFKDIAEDVVYRRGPGFRPIDLYDIWVDPQGTRINDDMLYIVKRFTTTEAQARDLVKRGTYQKEATERAILLAKSKGTKSAATKDGNAKRFEQFEQVQRYGGMSGFECWAQVPYKTRDKATNRVITLLEGEVVRSHINPYLDGMFPFVDFVVNPVFGQWYGMSPGEVVRFLQDATNHFLMAMTDAANMAIRSPLLVGHAFQGDLDRLQNRGPLDNIPCANPDAVKPLLTDLNTLQYAGVHYLQRINRIREATGATPGGVQPISPGEQTATQFRGVAELATERVAFMANLLERDAMPQVSRLFHSRLRQYMPQEGQIAQLGSDQFVFRPEDIDFDSEFEYTGSTTGLSAGQKFQQTTAAVTALMANPDALFVVPELVIRQLRDGLEIGDAEQLVEEAQKRLVELRNSQAQQETQGSPPAPRGQPTGGPL